MNKILRLGTERNVHKSGRLLFTFLDKVLKNSENLFVRNPRRSTLSLRIELNFLLNLALNLSLQLKRDMTGERPIKRKGRQEEQKLFSFILSLLRKKDIKL